MRTEREEIKSLIQEAKSSGAKQSDACEIIGISARTYQRWSQPDNSGDSRQVVKQKPKNSLTDSEREQIINLSNEPEYADLSPQKTVVKLADKGIYIASESSFYRVLKEEKQLKHRQKTKPPRKIIKPKALVATMPNQIYSWDISYLPTQVKGLFFYLYLVMDVYSRKIVGWQVYEQESSALAADLMTDICHREKIKRNQVTLHSDNGSPMKGATMLSTLQTLGVVPSFSRPSVSNDNPYSESLFRTLKYRPDYPEQAFKDMTSAREWVEDFVSWYNKEHLHSAIKYVTPEQRHKGEDKEILIARQQVYKEAKAKNPNRWSGDTRNWTPIVRVLLNPEKEKDKAA